MLTKGSETDETIALSSANTTHRLYLELEIRIFVPRVQTKRAAGSRPLYSSAKLSYAAPATSRRARRAAGTSLTPSPFTRSVAGLQGQMGRALAFEFADLFGGGFQLPDSRHVTAVTAGIQ
jgi:hypothetical protein